MQLLLTGKLQHQQFRGKRPINPGVDVGAKTLSRHFPLYLVGTATAVGTTTLRKW